MNQPHDPGADLRRRAREAEQLWRESLTTDELRQLDSVPDEPVPRGTRKCSPSHRHNDERDSPAWRKLHRRELIDLPDELAHTLDDEDRIERERLLRRETDEPSDVSSASVIEGMTADGEPGTVATIALLTDTDRPEVEADPDVARRGLRAELGIEPGRGRVVPVRRRQLDAGLAKRGCTRRDLRGVIGEP